MRCTTSAPLPFLGQKRRWIKDLVALLSDAPEPTTVVDVFGGSGLLSRLAKDLYPRAHVVYNDYDNYTDRLHHIEETERLRREIVAILAPLKCNSRVPDSYKVLILKAVQAHEERYKYVDWVTLSGWLLHTNNFAYSLPELASRSLYVSPTRTPLPDVSKYLQGLDIVSQDWRVLLEQYRNTPNALYIIDPPYLGALIDGYKGRVWTCNDYCDLAVSIPDAQALYFTSAKFDFIPAFRRIFPSLPIVESSEIERSSKVCGREAYNREILYYRLKCKKRGCPERHPLTWISTTSKQVVTDASSGQM